MKTTILISALFFSGLVFSQEQKPNDSIKTNSTKEIEEVTITKKVFKKESDRFVYDVAASPIAKGNTTFDLLKETPLLSSTDDKTLKIAGKSNAVIFINGRKTNMDAESLSQFLKNTPGENIQKIEVITVPGSEFQVEATDGIINIVLKKKMTDGLNGSLRMSNISDKYSNSSASLSTNYRKGDFGLSANLSGGENVNAQEYIIKNGNRTIKNESAGPIESPNLYLGGYINLDYQLNDKSNLALSWNSWISQNKNSTIDLRNRIDIYDDNLTLLNSHYTRSQSNQKTRSYNHSANLNYELKTDDKGSKLNLNASYLNYKKYDNAENYTLMSNANWENLGINQIILQNTPQLIDNFSTMADYIKKFENDFTIAVGANYNKTKTTNDTDYDSFNLINGNQESKPNKFIYDEDIIGTYLTLEKKLSEKLSGKIGARYEITSSVGTSNNAPKPEMERIEQKYNNLLPYLTLNYAINDNNNLSYAFSSRMKRPSFWELNPVKNIITQDNYTQNNPFVKASSSYNQELTYMYKNSYFLILNHSLTNDIITQIPLQRDIVRDGQTYRQLAYIRSNFGDRQQMSAMLGMQKTFFKQYLTTNFNIGVQHNRNNGSLNKDPTTGEIFDTYTNKSNSTSILIHTNNNIRLDKAKTWFAGINFFFVDQQQIELGRLKPLSSLDLSIKKLWNEWTFTIKANDVLNKNIVEIEDYQPNGSYNYLRNDQFNRSLSVSIVYNFGNQKVKKSRSIENANSEINSRTK